MVNMKRPEALKSPVSSQNDINNQSTHSRAPNDGANYDLLTGSSNEFSRGLSTRIQYYQPTPAMDGASHEHKDFAPFGAAALVRRPDPVNDESSSKVKMWDPVKSCSHPDTTQADVPGFLPARQHSSEQIVHSTTSGFTSMGLHLPHKNQPYIQAQDNQPPFMESGSREAASTGLAPYHQSHNMASGYQGNASTGLLPHPQSHAMASVCQFSASTGSQPFQVGHSYDQFQRSPQHRPGYENVSILPPHLRDPSGQQPLDSITRGAAVMGIQQRQVGNLHNCAQENGQRFTGIEPRMSTSVASQEPVHPQQSLPSTISSPSMERRSDLQQANHPQYQIPSADMSQAINMGRYAESLDQQSNRAEAMRAYEQAGALFQEVIIRSCSLEERMECNDARNACQARLDVLLRESAASPSSSPPGQSDQQEDDGPGGGKPQYSLFEDWALCRKMGEELSWQEVAETSVFKGRRKHRSLSQRKHTIGKMGPKYHEAEEPWTEDEDRKLCALGDAGKTLGDIHRKFRSRNAERCLNRYFHLKGYHSTGRSRTSTPQQTLHSPALHPVGAQHTHESSTIVEHPAYRYHPSASVVESLAQQHPTTSSQNSSPAFTPRSHTPGTSYSSSPFTGAETPVNSTASLSLSNAASTGPLTARIPGPPDPLRQQRPAESTSTPSSTSNLASPEGSEHPTPSMSAQMMLPNALRTSSGNVFDNSCSPEAVANKSTDCIFARRHTRPTASSSSSSASTANPPTNSASSTSSPNSPKKASPPLETYRSLDSHSAAANGVRKPPRTAHPKTL